MKKFRRFLCLFLTLALGTSLLSGCALDVNGIKTVMEEKGLIEAPPEPDYTAITDYSELDAEGEAFPSVDGYYIKHGDLYYPLGFATWCEDAEFKENGYGTKDLSEIVASDIRFAMPTEYDTYLPTLYLDNKDTLVYYSETNVLNAYMFTKLFDLGYSVPITSFEQTAAGYPYVSIDKQTEMDGEGVLLDCPARNEMLQQPVFQTKDSDEDAYADLRIFSVNSTEFNENFIKDNIITGLTRNGTYQFNGAFGSVDYQWSMDANYHYFIQKEIFAEADYTSAYNNLYTIPIPDYLTNGYYMLQDMTMFRLIKEGNGYNLLDKDSFNTKQLGLDTEYALANGGRYEEQFDTYYFADNTTATDDRHIYSSNKDLNVYVTKVPTALGYVPDETDAEEEKKEEKEDITQSVTDIQTAVYRISPMADSVKLKDESMVKVTSEIASSAIPPTVSYYSKNKETAVSMTKNEKDGLYEYDVVTNTTVSEDNNVYLIVRYPKNAKVNIKDIYDGLSIQYIQKTDDLTGIPEDITALVKKE